VLKIPPVRTPENRDLFYLTRPRAALEEGLPAILRPSPAVRLHTPATGRTLRPVPRHPPLRCAPPDLYGNNASQLSTFSRLENERGAAFARAATALAGEDGEGTTKVDTLFDGITMEKRKDQAFRQGLMDLSSEIQRLKNGQRAEVDTSAHFSGLSSGVVSGQANGMAPAAAVTKPKDRVPRKSSREKGGLNDRSATQRVARKLGDLRSDQKLRDELHERVQLYAASRRERMQSSVSCVRRNRLRTGLPMISCSSRDMSPPPSPTIPVSRLPAVLQPGDVVELVSADPPQMGLFVNHAQDPAFGLFRWDFQDELTETEWIQVRVPDQIPRRLLLQKAARGKQERAVETRWRLDQERTERMRAFDPLHAEPEHAGQMRRWLVTMTLARSANLFVQKAGALRNIMAKVLVNNAVRTIQRLWRAYYWEKKRNSENNLTRRMEGNLKTVWLRCVELRREERTTSGATDTVKWFFTKFVPRNALRWATLHILDTVRRVQRSYREGRIIRTARVAVLHHQFCNALKARAEAIASAFKAAGLGDLVGGTPAGAPLSPSSKRTRHVPGSTRPSPTEESPPPSPRPRALDAPAKSRSTAWFDPSMPPSVIFQGQNVPTERLREEWVDLTELQPGGSSTVHLDHVVLEIIRKKQMMYRLELREYVSALSAWRRMKVRFEIRLREAEREHATALNSELAGIAQQAVRGAAKKVLGKKKDEKKTDEEEGKKKKKLPFALPTSPPFSSASSLPATPALSPIPEQRTESSMTLRPSPLEQKNSGLSVTATRRTSGLGLGSRSISMQRTPSTNVDANKDVKKLAKRKKSLPQLTLARPGQNPSPKFPVEEMSSPILDSPTSPSPRRARRGSVTLGEVLARGMKRSDEQANWDCESSLGEKPMPPRWYLILPEKELLGWIGVAIQACRNARATEDKSSQDEEQ